MPLDFLLRQTSELPLHSLHRRNLNLTPPKITSQHTPQTNNRRPHRLIERILRNTLHPFLQKIRGLLLLRPTRRPLKRQKVPRRIHLQNLRPLLLIHPHDHHDHRQRPHAGTLRIHLGDIRHSLGQDGRGDGVAVLEFEVGGFVARALDSAVAVGDHAGGETADFGCDVEDVGDGGGDDEAVRDFALGDDDTSVFAAEGDAG
mmetsp:Transcript_187/g.381  ORF Transcript_187/g.381 Transcript_187/m.381 type:complete len:202 (-) Transcript_187:277-882(-)